MKQLVFLLLLCVIALFTGCREDFAGPDFGESAVVSSAPSPAFHAFTPSGSELVVAIKGGPILVDVGGSTPYTLTITGSLLEGGIAVGQASLADGTDPSRRFEYLVREGEARCDGGMPVATARGYGFITHDHGGTEEAFTHTFNFGFPDPPPPSGGGSSSRTGTVTLVEGEPAELEGETFRAEFDRVFVSPDICGAR